MKRESTKNTDDLKVGGKDAEPRMPSGQILRNELREAIDALDRPVHVLFVSGIAAGLEIGFSLLLMATMWTLCHDQLPHPVTSMLVATMYSFGFILVVLGRSELFTEQTSLAVMPVISGHASPVSALRLWGVVYVANLSGSALFAAMLAYTGPSLGIFDREALEVIARRMTDHSSGTILLSGILAGWLMGLLSWLVAAGRDTISQIVIVWLITSAIGLCGLHHAVLGSTEVLTGLFASSSIGASDFAHFLFWTTLGNTIGGPLFVAILKSGNANFKEARG